MSNAAITRTTHGTHNDYAFDFGGRPALVRVFPSLRDASKPGLTLVWLDNYQITPGNKAQSQKEILEHGRKLWAARVQKAEALR